MTFNSNRKVSVSEIARAHESAPTTNLAGGVAYENTPEMSLYKLAVTYMGADKFYETNQECMTRLRALLPQVRPEFIIKLAFYAREQMHMRAAPVVLLCELMKLKRGVVRARHIARAIQRADEDTEFAAYWAHINGGKLKPMPNALKRGIAQAEPKFDEYQHAKYLKGGKTVTKRNIFHLTHPKPRTPEQVEAFRKVADGTLRQFNTHQQRLSEAGQGDGGEAATRAVWESLIDERKLGYMALVKNLRNLLEANVSDEHLNKALSFLTNPKAVRESKLFPFRFLSAYQMLQRDASGNPRTRRVLDALEVAALESVHNVPGFEADKRVLISSDVSGSMSASVSDGSTMSRRDVGLLLGMLAQTKCANSVLSVFGTGFTTVALPTATPLGNIGSNRGDWGVGWNTNGHLVVEWALSKRQVFDRILIFTDEMLWDSYGCGASLQAAWKRYRAEVNPNARLILVNLAGYATSPVDVRPELGTYMVAGWNPEVFTLLARLEEGASMVEYIDKMYEV